MLTSRSLLLLLAASAEEFSVLAHSRELQEQAETEKGSGKGDREGKGGDKGSKGEGRTEGEGAAVAAGGTGESKGEGKREREGDEMREPTERGSGEGAENASKGQGKGGENGGESAVAARGENGENAGERTAKGEEKVKGGESGAGEGRSRSGSRGENGENGELSSEEAKKGKGNGETKSCVYVCNPDAENPFKSMKDKRAKDGSKDATVEKPDSTIETSPEAAATKVAKHGDMGASAEDKEVTEDGETKRKSNKKSKMQARREKAAAECSCATQGVSGTIEMDVSNVVEIAQNDEKQDTFGEIILDSLIEVVEVDYEQVALDSVNLVEDGAEGVVNLVKGTLRKLKVVRTLQNTAGNESSSGKARVEYEVAATDANQQNAVQEKLSKPENWSRFQDTANQKLNTATGGELQVVSPPVVVAAAQPVAYNTMNNAGANGNAASNAGAAPQNNFEYSAGVDGLAVTASGAAGVVVGMNAVLASLMTVYLLA